MDHIKPIAIKLISGLIILSLILGIGFDIGFGSIFIITILFGLTSFFLGDLFILPKTNNLGASIADFSLAFIFTYAVSASMNDTGNIATTALTASVAITIFEVFYHNYIEIKYDFNHIQRNRAKAQAHLNFQTETAEELYPEEDE